MKEEYLRKQAGQDLRQALMLAKLLTLTPEQEGELQTLYGRLDRLKAVEFVAVVNAGLDGGLPLRPKPERAPMPADYTAEDDRKRRERERTF